MNTEYRTARFNCGDRWQAALVRSGHKRLHVTFIDDGGLRHTTAPLEESRHIMPLTHRGEAYTVERMVRKLRGVATRMGASDAAKAELARAAL